jgi:hypothetical protein
LYGDAGSLKGGKGGGINQGRSGYLNFLEDAVAPSDTPDYLSVAEVYALPFGAGHSLGSSNKAVRALVSDWQISGIETYTAGYPLGLVGANCDAPYTGACYASFSPSFTGPAESGPLGAGNLLSSSPPHFVASSAFENPAPFTFGNTPPTLAYDLRGPTYMDEDFS